MIKNREKLFLPVLVVAVLLIMTIAAWQYVSITVNGLITGRFQADVNENFSQIQSTLKFYLNAVYAYQGFFEGSQLVERPEFAVYSKKVVTERYSGLYSVVYAERVKKENLSAFISAVRSDKSVNPKGYPDLKILPEGDREEYYPLKYIEPEVGNETAFGFDPYVLPDRRPAMERARDTGEPSATGELEIATLPAGANRGFIIFMPVYRSGAPRANAAERQRAIVGFIDLVFVSRDFFSAIVSKSPDIDIEIFDGAVPLKENLLYDSDAVLRTFEAGFKSRAVETKQLEVGGRTWTFKFIALSGYKLSFFAEYASLFTLFSGLIFSFLIFWIVYMFATGKEKAWLLAQEMTAKLRQSMAGEERKTEELAMKTDQLAEQNRELEDTKKAMLNLLEDLNAEKNKLSVEKVKYEALLESMGHSVVAADKESKIILMNRAAENELGWKFEEVRGKPFAEIIPLEDEDGRRLSFEEQPIGRTLLKGQRVTTGVFPAYYLVRKDKTRFPAVIIASPVILNGEIIGFIHSSRDITREKEIDRAKSEFVSIAAHQLRGPLATTSWYIEVLMEKESGALNETQKRYLEEVYHANHKMIDLVNSLLQVSKIELGIFMIESKLVNVSEVVDGVLEILGPQIKNKGLKITKDYDNILNINVDPTVIKTIFQNFLTNSIKYNNQDGSVSIEMRQENHSILVKVADTGMGIPKDQQYKIFTKFFRAPNAQKLDPEGAGLGLYIVKLMVEKVGGKIWFESEEGKGTTFYATLPLTNVSK